MCKSRENAHKFCFHIHIESNQAIYIYICTHNCIYTYIVIFDAEISVHLIKTKEMIHNTDKLYVQ